MVRSTELVGLYPQYWFHWYNLNSTELGIGPNLILNLTNEATKEMSDYLDWREGNMARVHEAL
jgi:hypothetical protein